jgi:hypothetical protein
VYAMWAGAAGTVADAAQVPSTKSGRVACSVHAARKWLGGGWRAWACGRVQSAYYLALYEADIDHGNFALKILTTCDNNSLCHMLVQGATATMEAWTRQEKDNLSWSHLLATAPATVRAPLSHPQPTHFHVSNPTHLCIPNPTHFRILNPAHGGLAQKGGPSPPDCV